MQGSATGVPVGTIITWPTSDWQTDMKTTGGKPDNFLLCNGQVVNSSKYPKLAKIMSSVPDYQGLFLRGYGSHGYSQMNGSLNGTTYTWYSSGNIGSIQGDAIRNIYGTVSTRTTWIDSAYGAFYPSGDSGGETIGSGSPAPDDFAFDVSRIVPVSNENRPINTAVVYLVRAK